MREVLNKGQLILVDSSHFVSVCLTAWCFQREVADKLLEMYQDTIHNGQYQIAGHWIQPMTQTKYDWNKI